jgi:sn-glycerol 3-phosphate transport system substrate-binding protein
MMRKLLGFLALLCLSVAPVLAQDGVVIDFYYPTAVDAPINTFLQEYADRFAEEHPEITINLVYSGSYTQTREAIITELNGGGAGPDLAVMLTTDLYSFVEEGTIYPAQDFLDTLDQAVVNEWVGDFYPSLLLNSTDSEGVLWSVPFQRSTPILYYNADLLREAGYEAAPQNIDELVEIAQALTLPNGERWGLMVPVQGTFPIWFFQSFAIANGQNLVDGDPTQVNFNTEAALNAVTKLVELGTTDGVMPAGGSAFGDTPTAFLAGQAAMMYHTTGTLSRVLNEATFEVGVGFLPSGPAGEDGTGYGTPTGGGNLYFFSNSTPEEREAAWLWAQFLSSPEIQSDWGVKTGYIAVRPSAWEIEPLVSRVAEFPQYGVARDQLTIAQYEFTAYRAIDIQAIVNTTLSGIISGATPLADAPAALETAQAQIDELLAEYR